MMRLLIRLFLDELYAWPAAFVACVPGRIGTQARALFYHVQLKKLGRGAHLGRWIRVLEPRGISIGKRFFCGDGCFFAATDGGKIEIDDDASMASNVVVDAGSQGVIKIGKGSGVAHNSVLRATRHNYADPSRPFLSQGHTPGTIIIEDDVWVASNCVLLPGTRIERGSVVASGSVVSGVVKAFSVVAGNPGRVVGKRG